HRTGRRKKVGAIITAFKGKISERAAQIIVQQKSRLVVIVRLRKKDTIGTMAESARSWQRGQPGKFGLLNIAAGRPSGGSVERQLLKFGRDGDPGSFFDQYPAPGIR